MCTASLHIGIQNIHSVTGRKNHMTRWAQTNTPEGGFIHTEMVRSEEWLAEEVRYSPCSPAVLVAELDRSLAGVWNQKKQAR